jgi:hypothetical protein
MSIQLLLLLTIYSLPLSVLAAEDSSETTVIAAPERAATPSPSLTGCAGAACLPTCKRWNDESVKAGRKWFFRSIMAHGAGTAASTWKRAALVAF